MSLKIASFEGIEPSSSQKLEKANIKTVSGLLNNCYLRTGRRTLQK